MDFIPKTTTILTGFLGAGKTTFLNEIILQHKSTRFAVIENEFGQENIDGELIINPSNELFEMTNGCLCCSLSEELYDILNELHHRQEHFDELIIEATGIADPAQLAESFFIIPAIKKHFPLRRVICLIEVGLLHEQLNKNKEAIQQIAFSDILVLNKTDLVSSQELEEARVLLSQLNPLAHIFEGHKNNYPIAAIFAAEKKIKPNSFVFNPNLNTNQPISVAQPQAHHFRHNDIVSLSFHFSEAFDMDYLQRRLLQYILFQAEEIYRIKGIFYQKNTPHQVILQAVGQRVVLEEGRLWKEDEPHLSRVVIIGKRLHAEGLEKLLQACFAK